TGQHLGCSAPVEIAWAVVKCPSVLAADDVFRPDHVIFRSPDGRRRILRSRDRRAGSGSGFPRHERGRGPGYGRSGGRFSRGIRRLEWKAGLGKYLVGRLLWVGKTWAAGLIHGYR